MALPSALFCGCSASALREAKEASGHISGPIKEGGILQYARSDVDYAARMREIHTAHSCMRTGVNSGQEVRSVARSRRGACSIPYRRLCPTTSHTNAPGGLVVSLGKNGSARELPGSKLHPR